jgi:hypothetical protein
MAIVRKLESPVADPIRLAFAISSDGVRARRPENAQETAAVEAEAPATARATGTATSAAENAEAAPGAPRT